MKVLVINPNTNPETTERLRCVGEAASRETTQVEVVTAPFGPMIIQSVEQSARAGEAVLAVLEENASRFDGAVIAAFSDPGLDQAKVIHGLPIVGIGEAAMLDAASWGERFSIITMGDDMPAYLAERAEIYNVKDQLVNVRILPWSVRAHTDANLATFLEECQRSRTEDSADAIVIGGGPLAGMAKTLEAQVGAPVIDGMVSAIELIEHLAASEPT